MGKAGLSAWKQMPQPTETSSDMSQLKAAERSFNKEAMRLQLEQQLPMLEAYAAIKDAIDGNASAEETSVLHRRPSRHWQTLPLQLAIRLCQS